MAAIRRARAGELDAVSGLLARAYAEYESAFPFPAAWQEYIGMVTDVRGRSDASELWVAEAEGGRLAASADYYPPGRDDYAEIVAFPASWAGLRFLATEPARRGSGLGQALVEHLAAHAREDGATHLGLHSHPMMAAAVRMYGRMGFERSPEHDFSPIPGADERVLGFVLTL